MLSLMFCRLRRAVLHPSLVLSAVGEVATAPDPEDMDVQTLIQNFSAGEKSAGTGNVFAEGVLNNLSNQEDIGECPICFDVMESPMIIPVCMHQWCVDPFPFIEFERSLVWQL